MGPILIIIAVLLVIAKHDKTKKRRKRTLWGKSDWEKTCDDGGESSLVGSVNLCCCSLPGVNL